LLAAYRVGDVRCGTTEKRGVAPERFMMVAALDVDSPRVPQTSGTIRNCHAADVTQLAKLFATIDVDVHLLLADARPPTGHLLALDINGVLVAAMFVELDPEHGTHGTVRVMVVDASVAANHAHLEERMLGVAMALCEAYGRPIA
jgi:hypothetical protein